MRGATRPDPARAKRAGLDLDLDTVCARGSAALAPDDHYRLKTYGVCAQRHDDLFMVRMRVAGGTLDRRQLAAVVHASSEYGHGWVHLTTRQNLELHSVRLDGEPGYQLWAGGSTGSSPRLSFLLRPFLSRMEVWPAVWTIVEWFCAEGDLDNASRGRLKFLLEARGENAFRAAFSRRFANLRA